MRSHNRFAVVLGLVALGAVARPAQAQVTEYYHLDGVGSVRAVTNPSGQVIEAHDYLPFGEECTVGACAGNPQVGAGQAKKFTGKERDTETGLDYFGARYLGSTLARFTTVDPVYSWQENLTDPQRWNRYAYARDNPLRFVDPDGRVVQLKGTTSEQQFLLTDIKQDLKPSERAFVSLSKSGRVQIAAGAQGTSPAFKDLRHLVRSLKKVEVTVAETATVKVVPRPMSRTVVVDLQQHGGGLTVSAEGSVSGNIEVYLDPRGNLQAAQSQIILGHELFGHARDYMDTGATSERSAVTKENLLRQEQHFPARPVPSN